MMMGRELRRRERERKMKVLIKISVSCHYHSLILVFHFLTLNKYGKYIYFCQGEIIIFFSFHFLCFHFAFSSSKPLRKKKLIHCSQEERNFFDIFLSNNISSSSSSSSSSSRSKYSGIYIAEPCENFCRNRII